MPDLKAAVSIQLAAAVLAAGESDFPDALLAAFRAVSGADLCSAFKVESDGAPEHLCSAGIHPHIPRFAEVASLDYASNYWQRDNVTRKVLNGGARNGGIHIARQAWNGISDPEYRRACYERADIVERITLYRLEGPRIFVSAYRTYDSGTSSALERERLESFGPILLAAVAKHAALRASASMLFPPLGEVIANLLQAEKALSAREAEVAAGLLLGKTQQDMAAESGVAMSSVITYRKRAYRKLGVEDRRDLLSFYRTLVKTH